MENNKDDLKKVIINSDGYYPQCPTCSSWNIKEEDIRCPDCNQLLDWSDVTRKE